MSGATLQGDPDALAAGGSVQVPPHTDPHGFLLGRSHEAALQGLHRALQERIRTVVLTGEPGSGRSSLLVRLASEFGAGPRVVLCRGNGLDFSQILAFLCVELDLSLGSPTRTAELGALARFLSGGSGRRVVLIVDDADRLAGEALEQLLRLVSGVPRSGDGFSLILSGGPGLQRLLKRGSGEHACLNGAMFTRLTRLDQEEATTLVEWVAERNSHRHGVGPSTAAIRKVVEIAQGNPATLAGTYDAAVSLAVSEGIACVSSALVERALEQSRRGSARIRPGADDATLPLGQSPVTTVGRRQPGTTRLDVQKWLVPAMFCVVLLVVVVIAVLEIRHRDDATLPVEAQVNDSRAGSSPTPTRSSGAVSPETPATPASAPVPRVPSSGGGEPQARTTATETEPTPAANGDPAPAAPRAALEEPAALAAFAPAALARNATDEAPEPMPASVDPPLTVAPVTVTSRAPAASAPARLGAPKPAERDSQRLSSHLRRAEEALARDALTTPQSDNAVLWAEKALAALPGEPRALGVLHRVVERYLGWSNARLARNDLSGARRYLDRALAVERHASRDQRAAMAVLDKAIRDRERGLARPARRSSGYQHEDPPPRWLEDVDSWLRSLPLPADR
jgi:type II secretory pathway predicted ATPase ExeA